MSLVQVDDDANSWSYKDDKTIINILLPNPDTKCEDDEEV